VLYHVVLGCHHEQSHSQSGQMSGCLLGARPAVGGIEGLLRGCIYWSDRSSLLTHSEMFGSSKMPQSPPSPGVVTRMKRIKPAE
jgi:hypothetical protein